MSKLSFRVSLIFFLQLYLHETTSQPQPRQQGNVCLFAGQTFQPGESYGDLFEIPRCGNWFDFPCFCNLDFDPPIDCPYCGLLIQRGEFVCAKENERVTIVNEQGTAQNCACLRRTPDSLGDNYLESICIDAPIPRPPPPTNLPTVLTSPPTIATNPPTRTPITNPPTIQVTLPPDNGGTPNNPNPTAAPFTPAPTTPAPTTQAPVTAAPTTAAPTTPAPSIGTTAPVDPNDVCVIDVDGISQTFLNGQSFGTSLLTRCIDAVEYPCFCDTSLDVKIRCPYCGYLTVTGELACARLDETIRFNDRSNAPTECTCLDDVSLASNCRDLSAPTSAPTRTIPITAEPTPSPTTPDPTPSPNSPAPTRPTTATPQPSISNAPSIAPAPVTPWPTISIDKPSIADPIRQPIAQPSTPKPSPDGCFFNYKSDESLGFVENGFPFGSDVVGPCPADEFPVICNTRLTAKREYPYCVFSSANQESDFSINGRSGMQQVCAASGSRVLITRTDGNRELCSCLYNNPAIGPVSQCKMVDFNYTEILFTQEPTMAPTITTLGNNLGVGDPINNPPISEASSTRRWSLAIMSCTSFIILLLVDLPI